MNEDSLVGKYLEIAGQIAGRIELEAEKEMLVRRAIYFPHEKYCGLCEQAVYVNKAVLEHYWVRVIGLSVIPETVNSVDSTDLVRKYLNI